MHRYVRGQLPKHGSWLNIAENELSSMTRQRIGDLGTLHDEVSASTLQMKVDDQL